MGPATGNKTPALPPAPAGARIGLLGGSFSPAHRGHLYISEQALEKLELDQVWWLVTPGNPLKQARDLAPIEKRIEGAKEITENNAIHVLDIERPLGLVYTVDILNYLKKAQPDIHFIWLMGADCFAQLPRWKSWDEIIHLVPVAVFSRPGFTEAALAGEAAQKYNKFRHPDDDFETLAVTQPPCWGYIAIEEQDVSSTRLRQRQVLQTTVK